VKTFEGEKESVAGSETKGLPSLTVMDATAKSGTLEQYLDCYSRNTTEPDHHMRHPTVERLDIGRCSNAAADGGNAWRGVKAVNTSNKKLK